MTEIEAIGREGGIRFGSIQVLDSVHTIADVNVQKDEAQQQKGGKPLRDANAKWGVRGITPLFPPCSTFWHDPEHINRQRGR